MEHVPVLQQEMMDLLSPQPGDHVLDCTLGLGGHALLLLRRIGSAGKLTGLDLDEENLAEARAHIGAVGMHADVRHESFGNLAACGFPAKSFDCIFADLGLSSPHIDDAARGFSFRQDAPLDLRFDRSRGKTAAELLRDCTENELTDFLFTYGELRIAKKLARFLKQPPAILTTIGLKERVLSATEHGASSILPQVFQALRIAVNDEFGALDALLRDAPPLLKQGGRFGIISYHSLEDRRVKQAFRALCDPARHPLTGMPLEEPVFSLLTRKSVRPSPEEVAKNFRARSARFRAIIRSSTV